MDTSSMTIHGFVLVVHMRAMRLAGLPFNSRGVPMFHAMKEGSSSKLGTRHSVVIT
jgi:hypothetical protein